MKQQTLPLCGPPGFEYKTQGPWFVCHSWPDDTRPQAWVVWTLDAATARFWASGDPAPSRRVMVDAMGVTVFGTEGGSVVTSMCGCRAVAEATLNLVRISPATVGCLESEVSILEMIDILQRNDGLVVG